MVQQLYLAPPELARAPLQLLLSSSLGPSLSSVSGSLSGVAVPVALAGMHLEQHTMLPTCQHGGIFSGQQTRT
jgi:hypothetical protein